MKWWRSVMAMELRKILAYRSDFWVTFLGQTLLQLVIARALWQSLFAAQNVETMNGFSISTITLYALIVPIGTKMLMGENIGFLSREIYDGTFTKYLIYPLSFFQYKSMTYLTYTLFYGVQLVLIYTLFRIFLSSEAMGSTEFVNLLLGLGLFLIGAITYMMMAMMVELLSLFADNIWSLLIMLRFFTSFFGGGMVPLSFFPEWATAIIRFTPFPYLVSLPVRTILGQTSVTEIAQGFGFLILWTLLFSMGLRLLWEKGQKSYTGVGI